MEQNSPAVVAPVEPSVRPLVDQWAADEYVQFVSRSDGQRTTATVSRGALLLLAERAMAAERERWEAVVFDGWRVLKGLDEAAAKRTTHQNVSDTLDALMRVLRA